jgi:hypothetical protein
MNLKQDLLHRQQTNEMARSYHKLEASTATSSHALEPTNPRLTRPSLILEELEFNLEYLRFAY